MAAIHQAASSFTKKHGENKKKDSRRIAGTKWDNKVIFVVLFVTFQIVLLERMTPMSISSPNHCNLSCRDGSIGMVSSSLSSSQTFLLPTDNNNDNAKIPGTFMKDKLYILGTRLTTSYDKYDTSVSFDMFGHALGKGSLFGDVNSNQGYLDPYPQLSYREASEQVFSCQVHHFTTTTNHNLNDKSNYSSTSSTRVPMELVTLLSVDRNTVRSHLIWRCPFPPRILDRSQLLLLQKTHAVRISVFTNEGNAYWDNASHVPILTVDIPIDTMTVGYAGPTVKSKTQPSFIHKIAQDGPLGVVLCVANVARNATSVMPEFIQHHINVGVEQIVLGIAKVGDLNYFQEELSYFLEQGVVVLTSLHPSIGYKRKRHSLIQDVEYHEMLKLRFYNTCLYHAKGVSEFVVNWDVDELWMPPFDTYYQKEEEEEEQPLHHSKPEEGMRSPNRNELWSQSPYRHALSLPVAIRSMRGKGGCADWCFQTFPSYIVARNAMPSVTSTTTTNNSSASSEEGQGYFGFTYRSPVLYHSWQKPVIRTKYAHQASFHLGGSCRRPPMPPRAEDDVLIFSPISYNRDFEDCPFFRRSTNSLGTMHHYFDLFRNNQEPGNFTELDEYTKYLRPTIVKQLECIL